MKRRVTWKRKDGRTVPITMLTNGHLLNIIGLLNRTKDTTINKLFPKYKDLIEEAKRRKLLGERYG